ncbi:acyltransferase family protein [Microbacterium terricola]|nr:acyltransferase family protein [Microbacterium terricola]UYK39729.1 acyltransferase family protein [Microbacterium terricola]
MPPHQGRIDWVDAGKGLAIALVVLFHSARWLAGIVGDISGWLWLNDFLATMRMPLFFTLSGLFAAKWAAVPLARLWNAKLRLFVWVFLLWEVLGLGPYLIGLAVHGVGINLRRELFETAISPLVPRFELWFIWALAVFFLLNRALRSVPVMITMSVAAVLSVVAFTDVIPLPSPSWTGVCKYYVFFLAGMTFKRALFQYASRSGWLLRGLVVTGWLAVAFVVTVFDASRIPGVYPALACLGVLAGVALSQVLQRVAAIVRLGSRTLPVYLAHTPIVILISAGLAWPPVNDVARVLAPALPPAVALAAIVLALGLYRVSARPPLRYLFEPPPRLLVAGTAGEATNAAR